MTFWFNILSVIHDNVGELSKVVQLSYLIFKYNVSFPTSKCINRRNFFFLQLHHHQCHIFHLLLLYYLLFWGEFDWFSTKITQMIKLDVILQCCKIHGLNLMAWRKSKENTSWNLVEPAILLKIQTWRLKLLRCMHDEVEGEGDGTVMVKWRWRRG